MLCLLQKDLTEDDEMMRKAEMGGALVPSSDICDVNGLPIDSGAVTGPGGVPMVND